MERSFFFGGSFKGLKGVFLFFACFNVKPRGQNSAFKHTFFLGAPSFFFLVKIPFWVFSFKNLNLKGQFFFFQNPLGFFFLFFLSFFPAKTLPPLRGGHTQKPPPSLFFLFWQCFFSFKKTQILFASHFFNKEEKQNYFLFLPFWGGFVLFLPLKFPQAGAFLLKKKNSLSFLNLGGPPQKKKKKNPGLFFTKALFGGGTIGAKSKKLEPPCLDPWGGNIAGGELISIFFFVSFGARCFLSFFSINFQQKPPNGRGGKKPHGKGGNFMC